MKKIAWMLIFAAMTVLGVGQASATARQQAIDIAFYNQVSDQVDFWYDDGDFPRMIRLMEVMVSVYPNDYEMMTNLGYLLMSTERFDEMMVVYQRYRKENPNDPDCALPEAGFYFQQKMYSKIPPLLEPAISKRAHANVFRLLGNAYKRMGMIKDAVRVWEIMVKRFPDDARAQAQLKAAKDQLKGG